MNKRANPDTDHMRVNRSTDKKAHQGAGIRYTLLVLLLLIPCLFAAAQDPARFRTEIDSLSRLVTDNPGSKKVLLFTGSSSIRMWHDIQEYFPDYCVINTGFGGSHMSDLHYYLRDLVLQYQPGQVFIYEGDNDVAEGKGAGRIRRDTRKVVREINRSLPGVRISLISPKPSPARWELRPQYGKVNRSLSAYAAREGIDFIDVWPVMLGPDGKPLEEIFIEDGLHMNGKGYKLWAAEIAKYIK
jgi:lysophospholipase L1-like esterase